MFSWLKSWVEGFFTIVHYEFQFDENPTTKLLKTLESIFLCQKNRFSIACSIFHEIWADIIFDQ